MTTNLLKKDAFLWCESVEIFKALKAKMLKEHVLAYPDFQKEFIVEIDACNARIGVVLSRENHLLLQLQTCRENESNFNLCEGNVHNFIGHEEMETLFVG